MHLRTYARGRTPRSVNPHQRVRTDGHNCSVAGALAPAHLHCRRRPCVAPSSRTHGCAACRSSNKNVCEFLRLSGRDLSSLKLARWVQDARAGRQGHCVRRRAGAVPRRSAPAHSRGFCPIVLLIQHHVRETAAGAAPKGAAPFLAPIMSRAESLMSGNPCSVVIETDDGYAHASARARARERERGRV